jgi:hypothetical protein
MTKTLARASNPARKSIMILRLVLARSEARTQWDILLKLALQSTLKSGGAEVSPGRLLFVSKRRWFSL